MQAHLRAGRAAMLSGLRGEPHQVQDPESETLYTTMQEEDAS
jgi:hypothetical protein